MTFPLGFFWLFARLTWMCPWEKKKNAFLVGFMIFYPNKKAISKFHHREFLSIFKVNIWHLVPTRGGDSFLCTCFMKLPLPCLSNLFINYESRSDKYTYNDFKPDLNRAIKRKTTTTEVAELSTSPKNNENKAVSS